MSITKEDLIGDGLHFTIEDRTLTKAASMGSGSVVRSILVLRSSGEVDVVETTYHGGELLPSLKTSVKTWTPTERRTMEGVRYWHDELSNTVIEGTSLADAIGRRLDEGIEGVLEEVEHLTSIGMHVGSDPKAAAVSDGRAMLYTIVSSMANNCKEVYRTIEVHGGRE